MILYISTGDAVLGYDAVQGVPKNVSPTIHVYCLLHFYSKADWTTFRSKIKDYQAKFLAEHHGRPVDELWTDLTNKIDQVTDQFIPTKVIKGKPSLPWISREIKQLIHKRDRYYKAYKKSGNSQLREKYVSLRHSIKRKIKDCHEAYLEGLLGMDGQTNQTVGQADSKKTLPVSEKFPDRPTRNTP